MLIINSYKSICYKNQKSRLLIPTFFVMYSGGGLQIRDALLNRFIYLGNPVTVAI